MTIRGIMVRTAVVAGVITVWRYDETQVVWCLCAFDWILLEVAMAIDRLERCG